MYAAPYASKAAAVVRTPIDERERQSNLDIANIQADVLNTRADEQADTLKVRTKAANKLNDAKIKNNQTQGFFGLAKGIVGAALPLIASSDRRIKNTIEELQRSNAAKDRFFNIISHDLKSPINQILQLTKLLEERFFKISEDKRLQFLAALRLLPFEALS